MRLFAQRIKVTPIGLAALDRTLPVVGHIGKYRFMRSMTLTTKIFRWGKCWRRMETAASVSSVGTSPAQSITTSDSDSWSSLAHCRPCRNSTTIRRSEERGKLIKAASERHAPPGEECELIGNFGQSEIKMIKYVDANLTKCGIPPQVAEQLRAGHKNTEVMRKKICAVAQQVQWRGPAGPVGDFDYVGAPPLVR
jgi:hypothetical protein